MLAPIFGSASKEKRTKLKIQQSKKGVRSWLIINGNLVKSKQNGAVICAVDSQTEMRE